MVTKKSFDLIVLGAGMAAVNAARRCAAAGWSVAIVDELPYGGTCALRGCDPKKILRRGAEVVEAARLMQGKGIEPHGLAINWPDLVAFARAFTEKMPARIEAGLKEKGVATLHGKARFCGSTEVEVEEYGRLQGKRILVATGAKPRPLSVAGHEYLTDSTQFLRMPDLPKRIIFVGGGFISFEFAHIAARAGSDVRIIDRGDRPLKAFDRQLVEKLIAYGSQIGIHLDRCTQLRSIRKAGSEFCVTVENDGKTRDLNADLVVHGAGRVPAIDHLDLEAGGIAAGPYGVAVNEYLQSHSNPHVYAAGDVADTAGAPLTPVAVLEGRTAAANMLDGNKERADYRGISSVVFTLPELARVGMLEEEARKAGHSIRLVENDTGEWYSNLRVGQSCAATRVIIDKDNDRILGAHLLGPEYSEIINFFGLAMRLELTVSQLRKMISAYPTVGSDLGSML